MRIVKINKIIVLLISILFPYLVLADNPKCNMIMKEDTKKEYDVGDVINISLGQKDLDNDLYTNSLTYKVMFNQDLFEIVKNGDNYVTTVSGWKVENEKLDNNLLTFSVNTTDLTKMRLDDIVSIKYRVKTNSLKKESIKFTLDSSSSLITYKLDEDGNILDTSKNTFNCEEKSIGVSVKTNNNLLSTIKIDNKDIDNFKSENNIYNLVVDSNKDKIVIEAVKEDNSASLSGDLGTKELVYGTNTFKINVTSYKKDVNTYTINVLRPDNRSTNNKLKTLKITNTNLNFKSDVNNYSLEVSNDIKKVVVTSTLEDNKAKYQEDYTNKEIVLNEGSNVITISIVAENGDINNYVINITRALSGNNSLKELYVNNERINIHNNEFSYTYTIENNISKVDIKATSYDDDAKIEIDDSSNLKVGDNELGIYVTAQNGDVVRYTLYVTRRPLLSNDKTLANLTVSGYSLPFDKDTNYYDLRIKNNEESLSIIATPNDEKAKVTIEGNENLVNGSIIKIMVQAEDKEIGRYFINIEKKNNNSLLWIMILSIILLIVGTIILVLVMKNKDKKEEKVKEELKEEPKEEKVKDEEIKGEEEKKEK